jgi:hypothetical protein
MSPSHLPVKLKSAASYKHLFIRLRIKTFRHVVNYYDTLFRYDIISDIHLYRLSYVCNMILVAEPT